MNLHGGLPAFNPVPRALNSLNLGLTSYVLFDYTVLSRGNLSAFAKNVWVYGVRDSASLPCIESLNGVEGRLSSWSPNSA